MEGGRAILPPMGIALRPLTGQQSNGQRVITALKQEARKNIGRKDTRVVVAQLLVAYLIELLGLFGVEKQPWEWRKAIGMGIAILGIVIFKWK